MVEASLPHFLSLLTHYTTTGTHVLNALIESGKSRLVSDFLCCRTTDHQNEGPHKGCSVCMVISTYLTKGKEIMSDSQNV